MLSILYHRLRNLIQAQTNAQRLTELEQQLAALSARVDIVRRTNTRYVYRAQLLEGRNRKLARELLDSQLRGDALTEQLRACRRHNDHLLEQFGDEAQRVIELEAEASGWITRGVMRVGVQNN